MLAQGSLCEAAMWKIGRGWY